MIRLKNEKEILGIRKSCKLLSQLFTVLLPQVQDGMSTKDIDSICVEFIKKNKGIPAWYSQGFDGAACVSINNEVIHGIPSKKRILKYGDIVSIDIGIDLDGYYSDRANTITVGRVSDEASQLIRVTDECLSRAIAACKVGNRLKDISHAVYDYATKQGFGVVSDFCGHGVGLDVHEDPSISNVPTKGPNPRIQAGMVLALEPMINAGTGNVYVLDDGWTVVTEDGRLSSHAEHTVAVFSDHTEILTL